MTLALELAAVRRSLAVPGSPWAAHAAIDCPCLACAADRLCVTVERLLPHTGALVAAVARERACRCDGHAGAVVAVARRLADEVGTEGGGTR